MGVLIVFSPNASIGENVVIKDGVIVEDHAVVGDGCYLDYNCIIRSGTVLGHNSYVGPSCILGEHNIDFYQDFTVRAHPLKIGERALIRSHSVIYGGSSIGDCLQTGHHVTIREGAQVGTHFRLGTLSDIQGDCEIGDYVNMHSNVHIGKGSKIGSYIWIFPYCVLTNDPIPPSYMTKGATIENYAVIATGSTLLPDIKVGENSLIGAASTVTRSVEPYTVVVGSPAKLKCYVSEIADPLTGESAYPWPNRFSRGLPWDGCGFDDWKTII